MKTTCQKLRFNHWRVEFRQFGDLPLWQKGGPCFFLGLAVGGLLS
jgi:hypothetical protein